MLTGMVWTALTFTTLSLGAVETPWGKGQSLGEKKTLGETTVCTDGKSHYVVVAPHEIRSHQLFYGDGKKFVPVPPPESNLSGESFLEPRFINPNANPDFRGADMRVYSSVDVKKGDNLCQLSCGKREVKLTTLDPEKAKEMLLKAKYEENPQKFVPHAFLRDTTGKYYLVERGARPGEEKSFRLWVGQKGKLVQEKMVNVVADSEGEIFSTKGGELRLLLDRVQPSVWIEGSKKTELRSVPITENLPLIYNELGPYRGQRLGTPCDDL